MYAIVQDRNRQFRVRPGESLLLDFNAGWSPGSEVVLDRVCLLGSEKETRIGEPFLEGAKVLLEVQGEEKGVKVLIGKFKRRKNYRRRAGFRARYTRVRVKSIEG